uniref:Uncharacterized protein n=1 Tax=Parascaris equorum TaxID=6256 RepID=A0A914S214_PAREQ
MLTSAKDRPEKRERTSSVEVHIVEQHKEPSSSVLDVQSATAHSELPMMHTQVPDIIGIGGLSSKGFSSCEIDGSSDERVIYGAEAEKQFEMMKRAQRGVEAVEKSGEHLSEAAYNASQADFTCGSNGTAAQRTSDAPNCATAIDLVNCNGNECGSC